MHDLVTITIDARDITVPRGTNIIEAARLLGNDIPHYCYHPKLPIAGNCRMCLVETGAPALDPATRAPLTDPATGKPKINWHPKPQIACATAATPGLHIRTTTPAIRDARESVLEFLLINHPLDCPICDQAGECQLQEQATAHGRGASRYIEPKNNKPKRTQLGPRVTLDDERCILCARCIRFTKHIAKDDVLGFIDRGSHSTLTCYPGKELANNYSLNTVDICPVGALTSTDFRFKMRIWFLKQTSSIDTESSVGANTTVWSREGQIYRITPRRNDEVNDTWLPDTARLHYKQVTSPTRLTTATPLPDLIAQAKAIIAERSQESGVRSQKLENRSHTDASSAQKDARQSRALSGTQSPLLTPDSSHPDSSCALVASAHSTVAEQYLTRKLADHLSIPATSRHLPAHHAPGDALLISSDRTPNTRGALLTGLITALPPPRLTQLAADIDANKITTLLVINEDLTHPDCGLTPAQLANPNLAIIYIGTHANATSAAAKLIIPTRTVFEKTGTFVNQQFRLQRFDPAIPGAPGTHNDLDILARLLAALGGHDFTTPPSTSGRGAGGEGLPQANTIWSRLAEEVPELANISPSTLPETGRLLDATRFAHLPFPEGETLHYKPQNR